MSSTVLGKRTRSALHTASATTPITRNKRRLVVNEPNDENENPFVTPDRNDDSGDEVEAPDSSPNKKTRLSARTVPAKHGAPESRVRLSPTKLRTPLKVCRAAAVEVYQDGTIDRTASPTTPRHRDSILKKGLVTPRHRILIAGKPATPRSTTTSSTPSNPVTAVYNQARSLFSRCSNPGKIIGRDNEKKELSCFLETCIESNSGGCLYVSGPPGTGKTALLDETVQNHAKKENVSVSVVNCMSVRNAKDLGQKLSEDFGLKENIGFDGLRSRFIRGKARDNQKYLVILDEVDRLVDLDLSLLYSLFEWSMQNASRLILIGIANALDLTDRFLPRLKSRNLKPELLPFMPYSAPQIAEVLTSKLRSLCSGEVQHPPFLHPAAVQFCAKKVASQTGDLRKAFDICRRAIDLVERETRQETARAAVNDSPSKTPLMENINLSSPHTPRSPSKSKGTAITTYTIETVPKATIAHMAKVTAQVFGNGTTQRLAGLNLQQKAVLCALTALEGAKNHENQFQRAIYATPSKNTNSSNSTTSAPSVAQLFEAYSGLCKRENLFHSLSRVEFRDVVTGLETLSLISAVDTKSSGFALPITPSRTPGRKSQGFSGGSAAALGDARKVSSAVGVDELTPALDGPGGDLLKQILRNGGSL